MDTEVEEKYSVDDDLSMLGPDAGRWWNYSEKGAGDDYSLEDIKDVDTYHEDTFASLSDESVLEVERNLFIEKLPTNSWKPIIPSRDPVSVTPSPFSWLPSIDIPQPYGPHSFSDDWVTVEHSKDAEETNILDKATVKDAVKEVTTDNSSAFQTRSRLIRLIRLVEWNSPVVDRLLEVR